MYKNIPDVITSKELIVIVKLWDECFRYLCSDKAAKKQRKHYKERNILCNIAWNPWNIVYTGSASLHQLIENSPH